MLCEGGDIEDASYCLLTYVLHPVVTHQQRAVKARRWFLGHRLIKRCNQEECCYFAVFFSNQMFLRICIIPLLKSVRFEQNGGYGTLIGTHVKEQKRKYACSAPKDARVWHKHFYNFTMVKFQSQS